MCAFNRSENFLVHMDEEKQLEKATMHRKMKGIK